MPLILVIMMAKLSGWLARLFGRGQGNALPGLVAERLKPDIVPLLAGQLKDGVILVTGTNGKTTTTQMLAAILGSGHGRLVTNRSGSNLNRGLASALVAATDWRGRVKGDLGLFEVDEAVFSKIVPTLKPKLSVILNLFRDQLDRYGELDSIAKSLGEALSKTRGKVILNADDPLVASLGTDLGQRVIYFGVEAAGQTKLAEDAAADSETCPICGRALRYSTRYYGHIGHYACPEGHFDRPTPDASARAEHGDIDGQSFIIKYQTDSGTINLPLPGLYNLYNALAAATVGLVLGVKLDHITEYLEGFSAAFGRAEQITVGDKRLYILLVKNPTGFNQVIQTFLLPNSKVPTLILINDKIADGRDVSWLWDVAFEAIADSKRSIIASGWRATDLALRLKYAEMSCQIEPDTGQAIADLLEAVKPGGIGFVLPTYTAMREVRQILGREADVTETVR